jgi:sugar lactone lactonase YvrE
MLAEYNLAEQRYVALRSIGDTRFERGDDASIPTSLCLSQDGKSLYITLWQCGIGVHIYDLADHCLRKPLNLPDVPGLQWPNCWTSDQVGKYLYVTLNHQTHLVRVDIATAQITELGPSDKALCRSGRDLYVAAPRGIRKIRL